MIWLHLSRGDHDIGLIWLGTEEYPNGVGHIVQRHPRISKIVGRGRVVNQSVTAYQLSDELS